MNNYTPIWRIVVNFLSKDKSESFKNILKRVQSFKPKVIERDVIDILDTLEQQERIEYKSTGYVNKEK